MKISCIIPAYNEERTVSYAVRAARNSRVFHEIIVVNDGSRDSTAAVLAQEKGIIFINLPRNVGKGGAVWHGLAQATGDIILLLDADLIGLTKHHFRTLLRPLLSRRVDVCIGIVMHKEKKWTSFIQKSMPTLSGQQAFWKKHVADVNIRNSKFGIETILKNHFKKLGLRSERIYLEGVKHIMKEEKRGAVPGFFARLRMYGDIGKVMKEDIEDKIRNA